MTTYGTESSEATGSAGDSLKDKAAGAAADVGEGAKNVAGVAKEEATSVAREAKSAARGLLSDARSQLTEQASTQKQRAADGLRSVGTQFSSMAEGAESGAARSLVRDLSTRADSVATWLADREPADIVQEVRGFARRNTGLFLAIAAGVGIVAGRVAKALHSGDPEEGGEYSAGRTTPAIGTRATAYDDTPVADAVASGQRATAGGATGYATGSPGYAATDAADPTGDAWAPGGAQGDRP
ncbi:hypothetical protein [Microbacterium sp.]|uniref:hypothetical protein n=1 Tax=Microbacterium sp. TaxID=51671 RepID=UPI0035B4BFBF